MTHALAPCPSCSRHVRTSEPSCPFCRASLTGETLVGGLVPGPSIRLSRAAAFAFTASVAVAGCTAGSSLGLDGGADDASAPDAGKKDSGFQNDSSVPKDEGGIAPPYGAPAYGQPPPFDSGGD